MIVLRFEDIDVARTYAVEVRKRNLALICTSLPEEDLARSEDIGERGSVRDVSPPSDLQVIRGDVFQSHITLETVFFRVVGVTFF